MIRIGQATGTRRRRVAWAGRRAEREPSPFRLRAGLNLVVLTSLTLAVPLVRGAPIRAQERGFAVPSVQIVATLLTDHKAFSRPTIAATKIDSVVARRPFTGESTALPVVGAFTATDATRWLQVRLPGRPNGRTAWIDSRATVASSTPWHIVVDLTGRRVVVYESGRALRSWPAIVGKASTPTPTGEFFVEEAIVLPAKAAGAPFALALSARSNVLQEFEGGPGQIALHGLANLGGVLGTAVSHGCIRLDRATMRWLVFRVGPGVPVTIRG